MKSVSSGRRVPGLGVRGRESTVLTLPTLEGCLATSDVPPFTSEESRLSVKNVGS